MEEALCWAYDTVPTRLHTVYWTNSFGDMCSRLQLKFGYEIASQYQYWESLVKVISMVFGGGKKSKPAASFDELTAAMKGVLGNKVAVDG